MHKVNLVASGTTKAQGFFNNLWQHQQNNEFCDFTLITNGSPIEYHKVVLSAASPYFKKLLLDSKDHKLLNIMDLSPTSLNVLNTAVAFMYNIDYNIKDDNVIELLKLSVKWQLDSLSKECLQYMSNNITIENAVMFYSFIVNEAKSCDSTKFRSFLCENFSDLYKQDYLKKLSLSNFSTLIADDNINVETEDVIFSAALKIINKHTSEADIDRCVGLIRFHQMSANFLLDVVQPHPVMLTPERCRLVREALRYQLTNQSSPSTRKGKRRAAHDIYYIVNDSIYRYKHDRSEVIVQNARIKSATSSAFHSNQLVVISQHEVRLINLKGNVNIEQLPRLPSKCLIDSSRVALTADSIYILNGTKRGYYDKGYDSFVLNRSLTNKAWKSIEPIPSALDSLSAVVSHKQYIYVLFMIRSTGFPAVYRYSTANNTWNTCRDLPEGVYNNNTDVLVHDDVINVFTSTTRFKYIEDSDNWSHDHYQLEGELVKVFVKGNAIRCVTCQKPGYEKLNYGQAHHWAPYGAYHHGAQRGASPMETQKIRYYLQTYDVITKQWIEKEQMNLDDKEPTGFF